jgi:hypothetical protein
VGQLGFHDLDKRLNAISAKGDSLEALNGLIPFESVRAEIEAVVRLAPEERKSMGSIDLPRRPSGSACGGFQPDPRDFKLAADAFRSKYVVHIAAELIGYRLTN